MAKTLKRIIAEKVTRKLFDKAVNLLYFIGTKRFYEEPVVIEPEEPVIITRVRLSNNTHSAVDTAVSRSKELIGVIQSRATDDRVVEAAKLRHNEFVKIAAVVRGSLGDNESAYSWELAFVGEDLFATELIELRRYTKGFGHQLATTVVHTIQKA